MFRDEIFYLKYVFTSCSTSKIMSELLPEENLFSENILKFNWNYIAFS